MDNVSNKIEYYRQCILRKHVPNSLDSGYLETVCWIPEKFAKVGLTISLKNGNIWDEDWEVIGASDKVDGELIKNQAHNSKDIWTATSGPYPRGNK